MAGAAIIVSLQQLKALLGIVHFTTEMGLVPVMASVFHHTKEVIDVSCSLIVFEACSRRSSYSQLTNVRVLIVFNWRCDTQWSWQTILMGICFLVLLLAARHVVRHSLPSHFRFPP
jgi:sulfate transporter 3